MDQSHIPYKANRILNLFLIGLLLIMSRVWYLSVIQHEEKLKESKKPQRRSVVEHIERATIRDRFNIPLATNQIKYNASVCYAQIREIPSIIWKKDEQGKSYRFQARLSYVTELAQILSKELAMDAQKIEDTIHGKASLFPHTPFVIKENITEKEYYRLRMLEREWLGIQAERSYKRIYPQEKVAGDIVGFMGAISQNEHKKIAQEIGELQEYISQREKGEIAFLPKGFETPLKVRKRLKELQEKAYTINDLVGKAGIEAAFDEQLRGFSGKKTYEVDVKGNFLRELPGTRNPIPGQRVILSLSSELQEFAEQLLGHYEERKKQKNPWIKGGAIVAMDPKSGELLALASYPRVDPNDFIQKNRSSILRWIENENHIAEIWNGKCLLERECYSFAQKKYYKEEVPLTWEKYLECILPEESPVKEVFSKLTNIHSIYSFLKHAKDSLDLEVLKPITSHEDRLLVVDLCRLLLNEEDFSDQLLQAIGDEKISHFRLMCQAVHSIEDLVKQEVRELYYDITFIPWRKDNFKEYLRQQRNIEKEKKQYIKPYTEYLDRLFKEMFDQFWQSHRLVFLRAVALQNEENNLPEQLTPYFSCLKPRSSPALNELKNLLLYLGDDLSIHYLKALRSFEDLQRPLLGKYKHIRHFKGKYLEKHLAAAFYPLTGYGYGRSQAYRQSTPQGSIFKLVTAYEALREKYYDLPTFSLNPLVLTDDLRAGGKTLGFTEKGEKISRLYKGGLLPRSHANIGKIDLIGALEQSSNLYFSILASDCIAQPENLCNAANLFGFGEKSGIELPGEIAGNIPNDLSYNPTGLYSFAIGQHSLVVTPLQTALMLSTIANHGDLLRPKVIKILAGKEPSERALFASSSFSFQEDLSLVGINFPLFSETEKNREESKVNVTPTEIRRSLFLPSEIHSMLLEGMRKVVQGNRGTARPSILRDLYDQPQFLRDYVELQKQIVGKTGTAEILYKGTIDAETKAKIYNHVWFGGIAFDPMTEEPDLVVVVYLRFGDAGKEAAPLAAQIVKKWRQIQTAHNLK